MLTHILSDADRHRSKDSVIAITLDANAAGSKVRVRNVGEAIPDQLFDKIFEYGVSDHKAENTSATRDQGLFVVKTYMAKMGDTVTAKNEVDGVSFELQFPPVVQRGNAKADAKSVDTRSLPLKSSGKLRAGAVA